MLIDAKGLIILSMSKVLKALSSGVKKLNMEQPSPRSGHVVKIGLCQVLWLPFVNGEWGWKEAARTG